VGYHDFMWFTIGQYKDFRDTSKPQSEQSSREDKPYAEKSPKHEFPSNSWHSSGARQTKNNEQRPKLEQSWSIVSSKTPSNHQKKPGTHSSLKKQVKNIKKDGELLPSSGSRHSIRLPSEREDQSSNAPSSKKTSYNEEEPVSDESQDEEMGLLDGLLEMIRELHEGIVVKVLETRNISKEEVQFSKIIRSVSNHSRRILVALVMDNFNEYWEAIGIKIPNEGQEKKFYELKNKIQTVKNVDDENEAMDFCKSFLKTIEIAKSTAKIIMDIAKK
jgi:hypothetical protein